MLHKLQNRQTFAIINRFCSQDNIGSSSLAQGNVSINVPQIIFPGDMSQVRVMNLRSGGAEMSPRTQNRRIISLPEACSESLTIKKKKKKNILRTSETIWCQIWCPITEWNWTPVNSLRAFRIWPEWTIFTHVASSCNLMGGKREDG